MQRSEYLKFQYQAAQKEFLWLDFLLALLYNSVQGIIHLDPPIGFTKKPFYDRLKNVKAQPSGKLFKKVKLPILIFPGPSISFF